MILKITNLRNAIIESFNIPVLYKNYIFLKGTRVVMFKQKKIHYCIFVL